MKEQLVSEQHFDALNNLLAPTLGDCSPETRIASSLHKLIGHLLDAYEKHWEAGIGFRYLARCFDAIHAWHG
jgi:hypothetical protein